MGSQKNSSHKHLILSIMKLFHFCILILLVLCIETEARRGGKGKGRRGKGKGKGKWRKNKGGKGGKGMIFSLIKDDLMSCKVDECWPTCFTQGCIDCKSACTTKIKLPKFLQIQ